MGHELKAPLAIMLGVCDRVLRRERLAGDDRVDVQRIRDSAYGLLEQVDELIATARREGETLAMDPADTDVARIVHDAVEALRVVAEARGLRLRVEAPTHLRARGDERKLLSVVSNLVANALRCTPAGGVVRCTLAVDGDRLRLAVADSGPGVPVELRDTIFERYARGDRRSAAAGGGSGLGLAIVREIVAMHGGTVSVSEAPEGGALFTVDLPRRAPTRASAPDLPRRAPTPASAPRARPSPRRGATAGRFARRAERHVFVVTADAALRASLTEHMPPHLATVHATGAPAAIRCANRDPPDAVLVDAALGRGTIAALRRRLRDTPILGIVDGPAERAQLTDLGLDDCLARPVPPPELRARLRLLLARAGARRTGVAAIARAASAFDAAPMPMAVVSKAGRFLWVNHALEQLLGADAVTLVGTAVADVLHPADVAGEARSRELALQRREAVARVSRRLRRSEATYVPVRLTVAPIEGDAAFALERLLWHVEPPAGDGSDGG